MVVLDHSPSNETEIHESIFLNKQTNEYMDRRECFSL